MEIRKIQKEDLLACSHILKDAYAETPYNEIFIGSNAEKYINDKYDNCYENSFVVTDENNDVIAFIFLNVSYWSNGPQVVLEEIVVDPRFQNQGIGKKLMQYTHDYLNSLNIKSVMLWVKKDNRLINFYENQGYFPADDFVVMFKNF